MEVTDGLLTTLVETKTIQRILAPISSNVSQLIIHLECCSNQQDTHNNVGISENLVVPGDVTIQNSIQKLVDSASNISNSSHPSDKYLLIDRDELLESCDQLTEAGDSLALAYTGYRAKIGIQSANMMIVAAKHLIQSTMKLLLLIDGSEVARIRMLCHRVKEKLGLLLSVQIMQNMASNLQVFLESVMDLAYAAYNRQFDLISDSRREVIVTSLITLKKAVPLMNAALQNCIKYPDNTQAFVTRDFAVSEIKNCIDNLLDAVTNRCSADDDKASLFLTLLDKVLSALSEEHRDLDSGDIEPFIDSLIQHAMSVAHLCSDHHRNVIIKCCQRILHQKVRVFELSCFRKSNMEMLELRCDFDSSCEDLTDDICDLERAVNTALVSLIVTVFYENSHPLDQVVLSALSQNDVSIQTTQLNNRIEEFCQYSDNICQIARLATHSSANSQRVTTIRACVQRLEQLDPEVAPAALAAIGNHGDKAAIKHLKLLQQEWCMEFKELIFCLDEMVDPRVFVDLSEKLLIDDINKCLDSLLTFDLSSLSNLQSAIVNKSERVLQVAKLVMDSHEEAVFRKNLNTCIDRLRKTLTSLKDSCRLLQENPSNKVVMDTVSRRLNLILEGVKQIHESLNGQNLNLLNPLKEKVIENTKNITDPVTTEKELINLEEVCSSNEKTTVQMKKNEYLMNDLQDGKNVEKCKYNGDKIKAMKLDKSNEISNVKCDKNWDEMKTPKVYCGNGDTVKFVDADFSNVEFDESGGEFYSAIEDGFGIERINLQQHSLHDEIKENDSFFSQEIFHQPKPTPDTKSSYHPKLKLWPQKKDNLPSYTDLVRNNAIARCVCDTIRLTNEIQAFIKITLSVCTEV